MKKLLIVLAALPLMGAFVAGCAGGEAPAETPAAETPAPEGE